SVFAGSFTLEAAEAVCEADLDLLTGLVDKSLVVTKSRRATVRYQLLETIRDYAAERLAASGEACDINRRHALAYLDFAREAAVDPMSGAVMANLERLDAEHDNVRAALSWSLEREPDAVALPLVALFRWYWYYRILWSEGLRWLTRALERSSPALSRDRAATLAGAGTMAAYTADVAAGRALLEEAEAMWRTLGDERELALTLSALAQLLANAGELDAASARAAESVSLARKAGTTYDVPYCLTNAVAFVANRRGDLAEADRALEEAESFWAPSEHPLGYPFVLSTRALLAFRRGDADTAARLARATLVASRPWNYVWFSARALRVLAFTSTDLPRAARLLGAADAMLRTIGARLLVHEKSEHERLMATLRASMPPAEVEAALEQGRSLSIEEAYDFALADPIAVAGDSPALRVSDLGPLQITHGGKPLDDSRAANRARELLVFLLAHPPGPTKEEVGVAFWPDATSEQVKNAFHVTLHRLRKLLGGSDTVVADGARYSVALPHEVASLRFESEVTIALRQNDVARLEAALALYAGDFLQGEDAGEWCLPIRARLRQLYVRGLFALGQSHEARGRYTDATETYQRVLARDPFHEPAARQLMLCHARLGARSESLNVYRDLEERLRADLQTAPEPDTAAVYRDLFGRRL
ncbi:MAG TPA: BTAD domain-containing putative transcriptional regulator, partial [Thermoanaerobaculia bacterium]